MVNSLIDQFGTETNPVGWSSTTPAQVLTGPRPFRESSESWLPGATRPLFQDELEKARQSSLGLFEQLGMIPSGGAGGKAAKMLASRRVSNLPTPPIRVYHGSNADFKKFSSDFMGKGEGRQSYSRGGYFAELEGVAKRYRDKLSPPDAAAIPMGEELRTLLTPELFNRLGYLPARKATEDYVRYLSQMREAQNPGNLPRYMTEAEIAVNQAQYDRIKRLSEIIKTLPESPLPSTGHMYEVDLHTAPNRLLDWDKPLGRQSKHVLEALQLNRPLIDGVDPVYSATLGHYVKPKNSISTLVRDPEQVKKIQQSGIDGLRYFDGNSRRAQSGSRNYVTYNDDIIEILRKYGIGGLGVGLSANPLLEQRGSAPQQGAPQ